MAAAARTGRASAVERLAPEPALDTARGLYERHGVRVFRFCLGRLGSHEEAEDARQTTFVYAVRALKRGVVPAAESSWLLKIAENVCKSRRSDTRRRVALEVVKDPESLQRVAAPATGDTELLMPLQEALGRLTEAQRRVLLLREWRGLSYDEIAEELGVGRGAVEALLFRARRTLVEELESPGEKQRRRRVRSLDAGWLFSAGKSFFGGGGVAAKMAATAVVVAATASTLAIAVPAEEAPTDNPGFGPMQRTADLRSLPRGAPARAVESNVETSQARPRTAAGAGERPGAPRLAPVTPATEAPGAPTRSGPEKTAPSAPTATPDPVAEAVDTVTRPVTATVEPVVETVVSTAGAVVEPVEEAAAPVVETVTGTVDEVVETTTTATGDALPPPPTLP